MQLQKTHAASYWWLKYKFVTLYRKLSRKKRALEMSAHL